MEIKDLHIWRNTPDADVTVGAEGILATSSNDSSDVSTVAVLIVVSAAQGVEVVNDSIVSLRVLQVVHTVNAAINNRHGHPRAVEAEVPGIVCQHSNGCVVHLPRDGPIG